MGIGAAATMATSRVMITVDDLTILLVLLLVVFDIARTVED